VKAAEAAEAGLPPPAKEQRGALLQLLPPPAEPMPPSLDDEEMGVKWGLVLHSADVRVPVAAGTIIVSADTISTVQVRDNLLLSRPLTRGLGSLRAVHAGGWTAAPDAPGQWRVDL